MLMKAHNCCVCFLSFVASNAVSITFRICFPTATNQKKKKKERENISVVCPPTVSMARSSAVKGKPEPRETNSQERGRESVLYRWAERRGREESMQLWFGGEGECRGASQLKGHPGMQRSFVLVH